MWRADDNVSQIAAYDDKKVDKTFIDSEFEDAILNLDFERAKVLNDARQVTVDEDVQRQEDHYKKEEQLYLQKIREELEVEYEKNQQEYEELVEEAKLEFEQEFQETEQRQQIEIQRLIDDWKIAREHERYKITAMIKDMIEEAQNLARTKAFDEAIMARDKAFALKEQKSYPEIVEIDRTYQEQMSAIMERHKREFADLKAYYDLKIEEFREQLETKNAYAEEQMKLDEACLPHLLMKVVINKSRNPDATVAVVQAVSPRKKQSEEKSSKMRSSIHNSFM